MPAEVSHSSQNHPNFLSPIAPLRRLCLFQLTAKLDALSCSSKSSLVEKIWWGNLYSLHARTLHFVDVHFLSTFTRAPGEEKELGVKIDRYENEERFEATNEHESARMGGAASVKICFDLWLRILTAHFQTRYCQTKLSIPRICKSGKWARRLDGKTMPSMKQATKTSSASLRSSASPRFKLQLRINLSRHPALFFCQLLHT